MLQMFAPLNHGRSLPDADITKRPFLFNTAGNFTCGTYKCLGRLAEVSK